MATRKGLVSAAAATVALSACVAWAATTVEGGVRPDRIGDRETTDVSGASTTTGTASAAPESARTPLGPPYPVGVAHVTMVDRTREVPARGPTPASPQRVLQVTIRYPADAGALDTYEAADAHATDGTVPLVLFAHGLALTDQTYPRLLHDLAASGFVVADPEFPLSSSALPGPATSGDVVEQARDLGFVANQILDSATRPPTLAPVTFADRVGVVGHSDGGVTAVGFAANSCCADPRVGAAVILSGALDRFPGSWFTTTAPPLLVLHGDADEVNPLSSSEAVYAAGSPPKLFAVILGGSHIGAFEDDVHRPAVAALVADFLRAFLEADQAATARLEMDAQVPGTLSLRARG